MNCLANSCAVNFQVLQSDTGLVTQTPVGFETAGIGISLLSVYVPHQSSDGGSALMLVISIQL